MDGNDAFQSKYMDMLQTLNKLKQRDEQNIKLVKLLGGLQQAVSNKQTPPAFQSRLLGFYQDEWDHQHLVCTALRRLGNKRRHDWSKDYVYLFILAGKFCFQIDNPELAKRVQDEVDRHYKFEPHHHQHTHTGGVIHDLDIQEMAVDQLMRAVWSEKGNIDVPVMDKYLPQFQGEHAGLKLALFKQYRDQYVDVVKNVYWEFLKEEQDRKSKI